MYPLHLVTSALISGLRLWAGGYARPAPHQPLQPLELYDIEACPFCRPVREALSYLALDALIYPCPNGGERFVAEAQKRGGKAQFPFLIDSNTGHQLHESADIVRYLFQKYGQTAPPLPNRLYLVNPLTSVLASTLRPLSGNLAQPGKAAEAPLVLYAYEAHPGCRLVRERLCELELPYLLHNAAPGSHRPTQHSLPCLYNPADKIELRGTRTILRYLDAHYRL